MSAMVIDSNDFPPDLVKKLAVAGFDLNRPISEYLNRDRQTLFFGQDVTPDTGYVLIGRKTFCGFKPEDSNNGEA